MAATTQAQQVLIMASGARGALPEEFWELIERYRAELVNQALAVLSNRSDAEEVAQETFCKAFQHRERLTQARSLGAWLRTINRANALDRLRKRQSEGLPRREAGLERATSGGFSQLELRDHISRAVDALPEKQRTVILLYYWEGLSCREIAQRLKWPLGTANWVLFDAGKRLYGALTRASVRSTLNSRDASNKQGGRNRT